MGHKPNRCVLATIVVVARGHPVVAGQTDGSVPAMGHGFDEGSVGQQGIDHGTSPAPSRIVEQGSPVLLK